MSTERRRYPRDEHEISIELETLHHFTRPAQLPRFSVVQINILNLLDRVRPTRPSDIACARGVSRSAVSHALKVLYRLELIDRRRSRADGRVVEVTLTEAGERAKYWPSTVDDEQVQRLVANLAPAQIYGFKRWLKMGTDAAMGCDYRKNSSVYGLRTGPGVWPEDGPYRRPLFLERRRETPPRDANAG